MLIVLANGAVLWWRLSRPARSVMPQSAMPLQAAQASAVLTWTKAGSVPLEDSRIIDYVRRMQWIGCIDAPPNMQALEPRALTTTQKEDLEKAVTGLLSAYSSGSATKLLRYMQERGQQLSPTSTRQLKDLLVKEANASEKKLSGMQPNEIFLMFTKNIGYASHWKEIVADSACAAIWQPTAEQVDAPLGRDAIGLFQNQTRFHHLFVDGSDGSGTNGSQQHILFADVRFVVRHDAEMLSEPSPYYVRFGYNPTRSRWQPTEMIHVPTTGGSSPKLLF